jgi:diguanylate cyclase (GGDEF)-like protein
MNLDPSTLLFSLILVNVMMVISLFIASSNQIDGRKQEGMNKWVLAMLLETLTWTLGAGRGAIPDFLSIVAANGLKAASHALILAAIYEFQRRHAPRWQYLVPVLLTLLMASILVDNMGGRFIWGALIYGLQMVLIARALLTDQETRAGRAWRLLFAGIVMILLVLGTRAILALSGHLELAQSQNGIPPHPIQIISFIGSLATTLLGSIGFILLVKERTDRAVMLLAMTDSLTQIPNRRALMDYAERALTRRSGLPLALIMIDVDRFKLVNDTHGHQVGDEVLRKLAALLSARLRKHDLLGRYGGEEFCVISPETNSKGALVLAESLRQAIACTPIHTEAGELSISVSIGISTCPLETSRELKDVLAEADAALYDAKQTGRNKVICFGIGST